MASLLVALLGFFPSENAAIAGAEYSLTIDLAYDQAIGRLPQTLPVATGSFDTIGRATLFLDGFRDDATPIALQPFLQRASSLTFTAAFGGSIDAPDSIATAILGDLATSTRRDRFSLSGELYVLPWLALTLATGYRFDSLDSPSRPTVHQEIIPFCAGVALRSGALRLALGLDGFYRRTDDGIDLTDDAHLRFVGDLRAVLVNHIDVGLAASAFGSGGDAAFHVDYYPSRRLGVRTRVYGGKTTVQPFPDGGTLAEFAGHDPLSAPGAHFGFLAGASFWYSSRIGFSADYGAAWIEGLTAGATDQRLILSVAGRSFF